MTEKFVITGMTCAACAAHVEKAANSVPGVKNAAVNLMLGTLVCDHGPEVDSSAIVAAVTRPGGTSARSRTRRPKPWANGCCGRWSALCPCSI